MSEEASRIEEALSRFDAAIDDLASAVERRTAEQGEAAAADSGGDAVQAQAKLQAELAALREDRARLVDELKGLRERNSALADTTTQAGRRVDAAMERIRAVLGDRADH